MIIFSKISTAFRKIIFKVGEKYWSTSSRFSYNYYITICYFYSRLTLRPARLLCMLTACMNFPVEPEPGGLAPCRNLLAIRDADLTSSPQPPHLNAFLAESAPKDTEVEVKCVEDVRADGEGGSRRGGVAHEHAARLPRAQPLANRQTAAAADIA